MERKKVLLDHSVREHARVAEEDLNGLRQRYELKGWLKAEVDALPKINALIRSGYILPYTYFELEAEAFRSAPFPAPKYVDYLFGVELSRVAAPLDRSKWGLSAELYASKEAQISFIECFFMSEDDDRILKFIEAMKNNPNIELSKFEEYCLRNRSGFQNLVRRVSREKMVDAFHFWTCEQNYLDCFLTNDAKFQRAIMQNSKHFRSKILLPNQLLDFFQGHNF